MEPEVSIYREPSDHEEEEEEEDTAERLQKLLQEKLNQNKKEAELLRMKVRHSDFFHFILIGPKYSCHR